MEVVATKVKKTKAKTKFWEIEEQRVLLPKGVSMETWRGGVQRLAVKWNEHGKSRRQTFPWTLTGLEEAKALNESLRREAKKYGADFGCITDDEKRALGRYREYIKEAQDHGYDYASAYEVMVSGLENRKTTSPDFNTLARFYFDKELMRKTDGELTDHTETVRQRLFNIVAPALVTNPLTLSRSRKYWTFWMG